MTRRLLVGYLSITFFVIVALGLPLGLLFASHEKANLVSTVQSDASRLATFAVLPLDGATDPASLREVAASYGRSTQGRVIVVDRTGRSVADSARPSGSSFASRPEVALALRGRESTGFRHSNTLHESLLFVAVPVNSGARILGVVRITYPASVVNGRIHRSWATIAVVGIVVVVAVTVVSLRVARSVTTPVRDLVAGAHQLGEGDLRTRVPVRHGPAELRDLTMSFNDTAEKLERLVSAQVAFVADASHQLRTPLTALRLRLENLESTAGAGKQRDDVSAALSEVHRLSRLVDGLLVLARTDAVPAAPRQLDVDAIVAGRLDAWAATAEARGVQLIVEGTAGTALATPDSLEQELDNLLANAVDVAPPGSVVVVRVESGSGWTDITVIDAGSGMTAEARANAFTRFLSTRSDAGGFGLGLAIAHRLVTRDGGELVLEEAAGGGLAARLRLRARPAGASRRSRQPGSMAGDL